MSRDDDVFIRNRLAQGQYINFYDDVRKGDNYGKEKKPLLPRILGIIIFCLIVIIISGTILAFILHPERIGKSYRQSDPSPQKVMNMSGKKGSAKVTAYTNIGQLRITTKADKGEAEGVAMVVAPWFTYPEGDTELFEELSQKEQLERKLITDYFTSRTKEELLRLGEKKVKEEIIKIINTQLVLGKIEGLYFDQYIFFE